MIQRRLRRDLKIVSTEKLLTLLSGVRETGDGKYVARCPAHGDRNPSLSISEGDNDTVLVHCFSGCETEDVLSAVGLTFSDLYPERIGAEHAYKPKRNGFDARQVLAAASQEIMVVCLIADKLASVVDDPDQSRLTIAAARLNNALNMSQSLGTPPEIKKIRRGGS